MCCGPAWRREFCLTTESQRTQRIGKDRGCRRAGDMASRKVTPSLSPRPAPGGAAALGLRSASPLSPPQVRFEPRTRTSGAHLPPLPSYRHQTGTGLPIAAMLAAAQKSRKRDQVEDAIGNNNTKRPLSRRRRATEAPPASLTFSFSAVPAPPPPASSAPPAPARARRRGCRCWRTRWCPRSCHPQGSAAPGPSGD